MVIPKNNYTEREKTVIQILLESNVELKTFLNVGFRDWNDSRVHWWINICNANNIDWKILEIFKSNVDISISNGCPKDKIVLGNILDIDSYDNTDCLLFWHGPEHIEKNVFIESLPKIEQKVNKLIIFGMPLGHEPQEDAHGNPYERHVSDWYENDWINLGYNVIPVRDNRQYHHITAYKVL